MKLLLELLCMEEYDEVVEMSGLITKTNSKSITGNRVSWKVNADKFLFGDYEMFVESRVVNLWAFIVSGLVILAAVVLLVVKGRK